MQAGQHISLFVAGVKDQIALKLIAAKGKVQAQSDDIELTADKNARLTAIKGKSLFNAKQVILLTAGGAYIRIKGGKIELHAPGKVSIKGGGHDWGGPKEMQAYLPILVGMLNQYNEKFILTDEHGTPLPNVPYKLTNSDGTVFRFRTNEKVKPRILAIKKYKLILNFNSTMEFNND